jgi:putative glutamine amidotransferase
VAIPTVGVIVSYGEARLFLERYGQVLERAGAVPVYLPYPARPETIERHLVACDGFMATGGEDVDPAEYGQARRPELGPVDRARDGFELALLRRAVERDRPVLAICRGVQALNVALGGTLYQDLRTEMPGALCHEPDPLWRAAGQLAPCAHDVAVEPDTLLARTIGWTRLSVNSYHHQAVREPGATVRVGARAPDGVVEAIEVPSRRFVLGVQWHVELLDGDRAADAILGRFLEACA